MNKDSMFPCLAAVAAFILAGCSSNDNPTGNNPPPDTKPPAVASVTPVDAGHIDVTFNEDVQRETAERLTNYNIIEVPPRAAADAWNASPGDTLRVGGASRRGDYRTVTLSTDQPMADVSYQLSVTGVSDVSGNKMIGPDQTLFTGTTAADVTPPVLVYRSPGAGAVGVGLQQPVVIRFSEVAIGIESGFSWTVVGGGPVPWVYAVDGTEYTLVPVTPLETGAQYTLSLAGVRDHSGNTMPTVTWSFSTIKTADTTPPTVVSSTPAGGATNVSTGSNISLTFSEPVNHIELYPQLLPDPGDGVVIWSNGGKTVTLDPDQPLASNQQYSLLVPPGAIRDLSGNRNVDLVSIAFSTGSALASGGFSGTLTGDPNSPPAADPTGALIAAAYPSPLDTDEFAVLGGATAGANDTYNVQHLGDGEYYAIAVLNTNGDNDVDPGAGDAFGVYGADLAHGDMTADSIIVTGGNPVTGIDFPLIDPSAITGRVSYTGAHSSDDRYIYVGVFDTAGFDPETSTPLYVTFGVWPYVPDFRFNSIDNDLADGTYYVAAFIDFNGNGDYDPSIDPAGVYGGAVPIQIHIAKGSDAIGISIALLDPAAVSSATKTAAAVRWPSPVHRAPWLDRISEAVRRSVLLKAQS